MDPDFSNALIKAKKRGVKIHVFNSLVSKEGIVLKDRGSLF
jgi:DNA-binding sugar fermentation-stimulating protein